MMSHRKEDMGINNKLLKLLWPNLKHSFSEQSKADPNIVIKNFEALL